MCNFPDDRWLQNSCKEDYEVIEDGLWGYRLWNKKTPSKVWRAELASLQNCVMNAPPCYEFRLEKG